VVLLRVPGSIGDVRDRLMLWAGRSQSSLARVEFASEFSRQRVVEELRSALAERSIPFHEIILPRQQEPIVVVLELLGKLAGLESGVVSITGWATAFSSQVRPEEAMRVVNFNRDRLVASGLNQIWWMTPAFLQTSLHAMPDLNSWFMVKLQLTEYQPAGEFSEKLDELSTTNTYANFDDARRRAHHLLQRLQAAKNAGVEDADLLETYLLPALENLAEVGAHQELQGLSLQFEGMLGQLKITDSPQLANALGRIANLYADQGRSAEAEPLYLRALAISEEQLGTNHPDTATSINNLATLYKSTGRYAEAEPLYLRALAIRKEQLGANHPDAATSINNLATLYKSTGRYAEAEPLYLRALAISEEQLGANHPNTATNLNNLATLYESTGRYAEAEPLYLRALAISEEQLGTNHPNTSTSLNNLATLYKSTGRYAEAEPLFLRALAIREEQLGANHPDTAASLNNLASLYESTGRYNEAETLYLRSLKILESMLGQDHPNTQRCRENLANLHRLHQPGESQ
jgi:tetratricopeptide (TPR) repeat protein